MHDQGLNQSQSIALANKIKQETKGVDVQVEEDVIRPLWCIVLTWDGIPHKAVIRSEGQWQERKGLYQ
jgi:hypothetical protein